MVRREPFVIIAGDILECKDKLEYISENAGVKDFYVVTSKVIAMLYGAFITSLYIDLAQIDIDCSDMTLDECVGALVTKSIVKYNVAKLAVAVKCLSVVELEDEYRKQRIIRALSVSYLQEALSVVAAYVIHLSTKYNLEN